MAQRKQREAPDVVKERIELAAIELFARRGSAATSVGVIAGSVGMSAQAVLYHYGNKAALHEGVMSRILAITASWLQRFGSPASLEVSLDGLTALLVSFAKDNPWVPIVILRELLASPDIAQQRFHEDTVEWRNRIAEALVMGQSVGIVRADLDAQRWFDRVALMLLSTISFPFREYPLDAENEAELAVDMKEAVRIGLTSVFVDPDPWLEGRGLMELL